MGLILSALWWIRVRGLWKLPDGRDWLWGELGLVLMGGAFLSKSVIQFSVDGHGCVPSLVSDLRPNYVGGNEDNGNLLQKVPCMHCCIQCPRPCSRPLLRHTSTGGPGHSQASLGQSLVECLLLFPGSWCRQSFVYALQESVSPVLCKFWQLYGGINGDLLQEGLCHTHVCCSQSPCPCGRQLLTHTSTGDIQTLKGRSDLVSVGSPCVHKVLFEPSEHLWWEWDLTLNVILPLLSCWGFSFVLEHGVCFLVRSNILLSMVVQQRVIILEFLQKMSAHPSSPPCCRR